MSRPRGTFKHDEQTLRRVHRLYHHGLDGRKLGLTFDRRTNQPLMKTITITAYNRPDCLLQVLASLLKQPPAILRQYELLIGVDPIVHGDSDWLPSVTTESMFNDIRIFHRLSGMHVSTLMRQAPLGINWNNHDLIGRAFAMGSAYNVALEDDTVLAPDALRMTDTIYQTEDRRVEKMDILNLYSRSLDHEHPLNLYIGRSFCPWGWVCTSEVWSILSARWMCDERGWDWSVNRTVQTQDLLVLNPCVSRVRNIGSQGVHHTPESHALEFPPELTFQQQPAEGEFRLIGGDELAAHYAGRLHLMPRCPIP